VFLPTPEFGTKITAELFYTSTINIVHIDGINNNNNNRISIQPSVVTSEAMCYAITDHLVTSRL